MRSHRPWDELTPREKEQVRLMLLSLKEFSYGYDNTELISKQVKSGSAIIRFYMNSLYQYFSNYFLIGGANKLANCLQQLGEEDLLDPVNELLDVVMDEVTVREIMRTWRDKFLTHQTFSFKVVDDRIFKKVDLMDLEKADTYSAIVTELFGRTKQLYVNLAMRFPEAIVG